MTMNSTVLLTIIAPQGLEEGLIDWLLAHHPTTRFSSQPVDCHGVAHEILTAAEQVTGRQRRTEIRLQVPVETARALCLALGQVFPHSEIHYWLMPVIESGWIDGDSDTATQAQ